MRAVRPQPPTETGRLDGLAWTRFEPTGDAVGGVVVLHGAASSQDSHWDFCRACAAHGLHALAFDARGHGASGGALDGRALDDVARMADLLRARGGVERVGLRGASMGGYFALAAALEARASAVVAICAASAAGLSAAVRAGSFAFASERDEVVALLKANAADAAARAVVDAGIPLLLMHAEGDEVVPVEHSRELHRAAPGSELVVVPGGHHRSVAHDPELQSVMIRFLVRSLHSA